jgi:transketolase
MDKTRLEYLADFAFRVRRNCIRMTNHGHSGHVGSMLSMADMLPVIYTQILNVDPKELIKSEYPT